MLESPCMQQLPDGIITEIAYAPKRAHDWVSVVGSSQLHPEKKEYMSGHVFTLHSLRSGIARVAFNSYIEDMDDVPKANGMFRVKNRVWSYDETYKPVDWPARHLFRLGVRLGKPIIVDPSLLLSDSDIKSHLETKVKVGGRIASEIEVDPRSYVKDNLLWIPVNLVTYHPPDNWQWDTLQRVVDYGVQRFDLRTYKKPIFHEPDAGIPVPAFGGTIGTIDLTIHNPRIGGLVKRTDVPSILHSSSIYLQPGNQVMPNGSQYQVDYEVMGDRIQDRYVNFIGVAFFYATFLDNKPLIFRSAKLASR